MEAQAARFEIDHPTSTLMARVQVLEAARASSKARIAGLRARLDAVEGAIQELAVDTFIAGDDQDPAAGLRELRRVTRPGGRLLITVPAYQALWSRHDVVNGHRRRYDRAMVRALAAESGWTIERMTSFNLLLLAPAAAVRLLQRRSADRPRDGAHRSELELTPGPLNRLLELPLRLEAVRFAAGGPRPAPAAAGRLPR